MNKLVGLLDSVIANATDTEIESKALAGTAEVRRVEVADETELPAWFDEVDAIIIWHQVKLSAVSLRRLRRCGIIVRNGVGYDNVDIKTAGALGIAVANVPDYGTEEVADHAMALTLALLRHLPPLLAQTRSGGWDWKVVEGQVPRLRDMTFGIIGLGRIGTAVALRAKAFGFKVVFYDPYLAPGVEKALGLTRADELSDLLRMADVVSLHCPLTEETRGMIGRKEFNAMKPGSFLVNTARGGIVDQEALKEALRKGIVAGAGLDVVTTEPPNDPELVGMENVLLTPHAAFYSRESFIECRRSSALIVKRFFETGKVLNLVNGESLMPKTR
ncbi:MAG: C-terminal binding protein [Firmicutes bacterium]|nr:C-terminal binding protein [Bacillota bacterium]